MLPRRATLAVLAGFLVVASACASVHPVGAAAAGPGPTAAETGAASEPLTDAQPVPAGVHPLALAADTPIGLTLTLAGADPGGLSAFLAAIEDPASPQYGHYLTSAEYDAEFAPPPSSVAEASSFLSGHGATDLEVVPGDLGVRAVVPAGEVESMFGVELDDLGASGASPLYTSVGAVTLPSALAKIVTGIGGLSNAADPALSYEMTASAPVPLTDPATAPAYIEGNTSGAQWFLGSDFTEALGASELLAGGDVLNATYPTHVAVATLLASGWNESTGTDLAPFDPTVVDWYLEHTLGPGWPVSNVTGVPVTLDGLTPPPPGPYTGLNDSTLDQVENCLDLEMAGSLAPGAPLYNFYFSGSLVTGSATLGDIADDFGYELGAALNYSYGAAGLAAVSASFGLPDTTDAIWDAGLAKAAATGVTISVASGDQGNAPDSLTGRATGPWPSWPASAAFNTSGAIAVGGVSLTLSGVPAGWYNETGGFVVEFDGNITGIRNVVTWYDTLGGPGEYAGSEGGLSTVYAEPSWQFHSAAQPAIASAAATQGLGVLDRAEPDVAFPANTTIVTVFANATGAIFGELLEGTSIAAPTFAGLVADEVAVRSDNSLATFRPLGYLDPALYASASFYAAHPSVPTSPFLDVVEGNNYVFAAAAGWDPTTGWGTLEAVPLLAMLYNGTITGYVYTGPTPGIPPSSGGSSFPWATVEIIFGVGVAVAVVLVLVLVRPSRPKPAAVPWGAHAPSPPPAAPPLPPAAPPGSAGATFQCPYCGTARPAEPVRCPQCGAL
ncbi:MAG TPA: protease pro-enzyme activation domain-containing protein [Thermoplasmata archaeon]|nr:protease pro-enzyme activation domain-containing protein [Thermoplasmata archaeon]